MIVSLNPEGMHSPERTQAVGVVLADAVYVLNQATRGDAPGLARVADACGLLDSLQAATGGMHQLAQQIAAFLAAQERTGLLADSQDRDPAGQVAAALLHLLEAHNLAESLTTALQLAQGAIAGLSAQGGSDG